MFKNLFLALFSLVLILCLSACQNDNSATATDKENETSSNAVKTESGTAYPGLPNEEFTTLYTTVDEIDLIAYEASLSMNFGNAESVRYILQLINREAATVTPNCKPTAILSLNSKGEIAREIELYFHNGCAIATFIKDKKIQYANELSLTGIDFFKRFIPENKTNYTEEDIEEMKKAYKAGGGTQSTDGK